MSKKSSVYMNGQKVDVSEVNGTIYVEKTQEAANGMYQPREIAFAITPEEARYLVFALQSVLGDASPMEPKEKVKTE